MVTFYHDFRDDPAGRHVLKICLAESCQAVGCDALVQPRQSPTGRRASRHHRRWGHHPRAGLLPRELRPLSRPDGGWRGARPGDSGEARRAGCRVCGGRYDPGLRSPRFRRPLGRGRGGGPSPSRPKRWLAGQPDHPGPQWLPRALLAGAAGRGGDRRRPGGLRAGTPRPTSPELFDAGFLTGGKHRLGPGDRSRRFPTSSGRSG